MMTRGILFFCLALLTAGNASAQGVKAVIVGDTNDIDIGPGVKANQKFVQNLLNSLTAEAGLQVEKVAVIDNNFDCKTILAAISTLEVDASDTVIFYYSGHGYRLAGMTSPFPAFDCARASPAGAPVTMAALVDQVSKKHPRFLLAIADSCNDFLDREIGGKGAQGGTVASANKRKAGFLKLFASYRGTVQMSGAVPGERSWYLRAKDNAGGLFSRQLFAEIDRQVSLYGVNVTWEKVAAAASAPIKLPPNRFGVTTQLPQHIENIDQAP